MVRTGLVAIALLLVSTLAIEAQPRDNTHNNLALAKQAVKQGYPGRAKELVDRAAAPKAQTLLKR